MAARLAARAGGDLLSALAELPAGQRTGIRAEPRGFRDFLNEPRLGGAPIPLAAVLQAALVTATAFLAARAAGKLLRDRGGLPLRTLFLGDSPETVLTAAAFWGYGGLLTLITFAGAGSYRHYMEIIAPIMALWTALFALWTDKGARRAVGKADARRAVRGAGGAQPAAAGLHRPRGATTGDFGVSWKTQQAGMHLSPGTYPSRE